MKKSEGVKVFSVISIVAILFSLFSYFMYLALEEGEIVGYSVAKFESVNRVDSLKGVSNYYVEYEFYGHKIKETIHQTEYNDLRENQPEYVLIGLYETEKYFGNKVRLGLPNSGRYSVEKYKDLVEEEVEVIREHEKTMN